MCKENDYTIDSGASDSIRGYLKECVSKKDDNFANGRLVRNLYDNLVMCHARRVVNIKNPTIYDLKTILSEDFDFADC